MRGVTVTKTSRPSFLLGVSAALGAVLAVSVIAFAGGSEGSLQSPARTVAATALLASFVGDRSGTDELPAQARAELTELVAAAPSSELNPGTLVFTASRRPLTDTSNGLEMYVVPTAKGDACYLLTPSNHSGCITGVRLGADDVDWGLFDPDGIGQGAPLVVHGLTTGRVTAVELIFAADARPALLHDGAFVAVVPNAAGYPTGLRIRAGGKSSTISIPQAPTPDS